MAKTMYRDCSSCGTRFDWEISQEDPICERCKVKQGADVRKIIAMIGENRVPGQKELLHVLTLMLGRIEALESAQKPEGKKGIFS